MKAVCVVGPASRSDSETAASAVLSWAGRVVIVVGMTYIEDQTSLCIYVSYTLLLGQ